MIEAGCATCGAHKLAFRTYVDATIPFMEGEPVGRPTWIYDGEKFVDGVYQVTCAECARALFSPLRHGRLSVQQALRLIPTSAPGAAGAGRPTNSTTGPPPWAAPLTPSTRVYLFPLRMSHRAGVWPASARQAITPCTLTSIQPSDQWHRFYGSRQARRAPRSVRDIHCQATLTPALSQR